MIGDETILKGYNFNESYTPAVRKEGAGKVKQYLKHPTFDITKQTQAALPTPQKASYYITEKKELFGKDPAFRMDYNPFTNVPLQPGLVPLSRDATVLRHDRFHH